MQKEPASQRKLLRKAVESLRHRSLGHVRRVSLSNDLLPISSERRISGFIGHFKALNPTALLSVWDAFKQRNDHRPGQAKEAKGDFEREFEDVEHVALPVQMGTEPGEPFKGSKGRQAAAQSGNFKSITEIGSALTGQSASTSEYQLPGWVASIS